MFETSALSGSGQAGPVNPARRHIPMPPAVLRRTVTLLSLVVLCSCTAITDPYVTIDVTANPTPKFSQAVEEARKVSKAFHERLTGLEQYDVSTGALMFGAGLAALGFAAFDAHHDNVIGAGLGAATVAGTRSFFPVQDRKAAYATGSAAIECAIAAFSLNVDDAGTTGPLVRAKTSLDEVVFPDITGERSLGARIQTLRSQSFATTSNTVIATMSAAGSQAARLVRSMNRTDQNRTRLVSTVQGLIDSRGQGLMAATAGIVTAVNAQILTARIDPEAAIKIVRDQFSKYTDETQKAGDETRKSAEDTKLDGQETAQALLVAQAARQFAIESRTLDKDTQPVIDMGDAANGIEFMATEAEGGANDVSRLAQQIMKMVKQAAACAIGSGDSSGSGS